MVLFLAFSLPRPTPWKSVTRSTRLLKRQILTGMIANFRYGWIGVPWLYGPEVSFFFLLLSFTAPCVAPYVLTRDVADRTTQTSTSRWRSWCIRRMAVQFHHGVRGWYRLAKRRLEDLDLDVAVLRGRRSICVLSMPRGKFETFCPSRPGRREFRC